MRSVEGRNKSPFETWQLLLLGFWGIIPFSTSYFIMPPLLLNELRRGLGNPCLETPSSEEMAAALSLVGWETLVFCSSCWIASPRRWKRWQGQHSLDVGLPWAQELRSGRLHWALPSRQWKFRAHDLAQGSPPWLSTSSLAPRQALHLWIGITWNEHSLEGCLCLRPTFCHVPCDRQHKNGSLLLSILLTAMIR